MGVRRQVYLDERAEALLIAESAVTGLSVSALVRRAIRECYGVRGTLSWDEVFARRAHVGSAREDSWDLDTLFDTDEQLGI